LALGWRISQTKKQTRKEDQIELRKRKDGGLSLTTISRILENTKSPKSFTELRMCSKPLFKAGFIKYLKWIKEKEFVNYGKEVNLHGNNIIEYTLSQKGWNFLDLVE